MMYELELLIIADDDVYYDNPIFTFESIDKCLEQATFFLSQGYRIAIEEVERKIESVAK